MQTNSKSLDEIRDVNLSYLILARTMLDSDRNQALLQLGISERVATLISSLTPAQLVKAASCNFLLCSLRCNDEFTWSRFSDVSGTGDPGQKNASLLHARILMVGASVSDLGS